LDLLATWEFSFALFFLIVIVVGFPADPQLTTCGTTHFVFRVLVFIELRLVRAVLAKKTMSDLETPEEQLTKQAQENANAKRLGFLSVIVVCIFCAAFFPVFFSKYYPISVVRNWPGSTCTVVSSTIENDRTFWTSWYRGQVRSFF
jgi:DMSO reductase anchor subunit